MRRALFWLLLLTALSSFAAPLPKNHGDNSNLESFQIVWNTVNEKHWDLKGAGVHWDRIYERYRPRAERAGSRVKMRSLITEMLAELGQSHFQILEQDDLEELGDLQAKLGGGSATAGFKVAPVGRRLFIVKLEPESDAAAQGLHIGTQILAIEDVPAAEIIAKVEKAFAESSHTELHTLRTLNSFLTGFEGSKMSLKIRDRNQEKEAELKLAKPSGRYVELLNLSSIFYQYESRVLDSNIGYISFNVFLPDVKKSFENDLIHHMAETDGLIIDLRDNPGGLGLLSVALAGRLVSEKNLRLGSMRNSGGSMNFAIFPQRPVYTKPVAIILNGGSASTSEIFAAGLQDLGRARIFGSRSAGAALPSFIVDLPNGDRFQYAIADYVTYKGRHLEGQGVIPDEPTPHTLESMGAGQDASLRAAIAWITGSTHVSGVENEKL